MSANPPANVILIGKAVRGHDCRLGSKAAAAETGETRNRQLRHILLSLSDEDAVCSNGTGAGACGRGGLRSHSFIIRAHAAEVNSQVIDGGRGNDMRLRTSPQP